MAALVTGATGFIGRSLTERLISAGETVRLITRDSSRVPLEWRGRVQVIEGSLVDKEARRAATKGVSLIFNLAGEIRNPDSMRAVNIEAMVGLMEDAVTAEVKRIVHLSSVGVIGSNPSGVINEQTVSRPENLYEQTKWEGEQAICAYGQSSQMEVVIVRPTIVFGEGAEHTPNSFLEWLKAVQSGRFMYIGINAVANYVYVGDVVEAMTFLADRHDTSGEIYIIADPVPMREFVQAMALALGVVPPRRSLPVWLAFGAAFGLEMSQKLLGTATPLTRARVRALASDCLYSGKKLLATGFQLPYGYRNGMQRTVEWYKKSGKL